MTAIETRCKRRDRSSVITQSLELLDFVLIGDSADVVAKANGVPGCRGDAARPLERFRTLASSTSPPRARNTAAALPNCV